jgi:hypothetical protein
MRSISLQHLIRPQQQRRGNRQAEGFSLIEIDDQVVLRWLLNGQIRRLRALEEFVDVNGDPRNVSSKLTP